MVAIAKILFATLGMSAAHAATLASSCPSGQTLISNNKCCPGYAIIGDKTDSTKTVCCVTDQGSGNCKGVGVCGGSLGASCKAKVDVTDSDYDQKVQAALSGSTTSSQTGSSSSSSPATGTPTASSTPSSSSSSSPSSSSSSSSDSDSGSSSGSDSSSSSSSTSAATGNAVGGQKATLGMVAALAAVSAVFYGL
ncbi:hypothetical protein F5Y13DRAFT_205526 [Hypoxylon sp. FL1857]|nr:hypothetical protein F5Y13DRAFT_205526 [Hypoxylon sp. FL1857]